MTIKVCEESYNHSVTADERKITTSSSAFGILRQQLVRNIGIDRMKGFLFHFGWEMGINDAKEAMKTESSLEELIKYGPILHMESGQIRGIQHQCVVKKEEQGKVLSVLGTGVWIDSYEAAEHIKRLGISKTQVCHTLIGYSSGFMSTIFGEQLLAREITCVGRGDAECRWVIKTQKEWVQEKDEELHFYDETPIVKELQYTYDQLLEQKNIVTRLSDFQNKLTEEVSNGSQLKAIADMVYNLIHVPIVMEDTEFEAIAYAGLTEHEYLELKADKEQGFAAKDSVPLVRRNRIRTEALDILIAPIYVQKEILGYCSFLYKQLQEEKLDENYLLLDRVANAASLILLNEKTRFESFERMKGNFLDQILDETFPVAEIIKRGKYTGLDLTQPYSIAVMEYRRAQSSIEEEFLLQEQIFEATFRFFKEKKQRLLAGHRDGNLVLLITEETSRQTAIYDVIKSFHDYLLSKYPQGQYKFGISNRGNEIKHASKAYEEAAIALRLTMRKPVVLFQSLGIVGVLINSKNQSGITMIAEQELGPLYTTKDSKARELLRTLYIFLLNGGKLEQTMADLSLSMSGLRHRIEKIESLLNKDLRDPNETYQLLLIMKSLIALGELDME
ncbi:XylR N-terminal domain-containing protein [Paenibacillus rigui]|uniref:PucR family transcriptional regulator n=1 Tax=Paenibacillus rigui TaxID=554312 RepID=A0A229UTL9_9BACL|nr:XylR N-terminal domain-containing protein [Paenibacillus rigui]OXM86967.1 PucR family transcriptional regulator [Paenibacillus rigui]